MSACRRAPRPPASQCRSNPELHEPRPTIHADATDRPFAVDFAEGRSARSLPRRQQRPLTCEEQPVLQQLSGTGGHRARDVIAREPWPWLPIPHSPRLRRNACFLVTHLIIFCPEGIP